MNPPDTRVAALAQQRDFLLRSLDDLEAEHAAGDLDDEDYRSLRADYTKRAAVAIRALDRPAEPAAAVSSEPEATRQGGPVALWVLGLAALAAVAWLLLISFSGTRGAGDSITGDIRESIRSQLFEAQQTFASGDLAGAIEIYDEILEQQPTNAEALAYKGWFTNLGGDPLAARVLVEDAVAFDPDHPDARVFATSLALELDDPEAAAAHLAVFDTLDAAPFVEQLVADFGLHERVAAALVERGEVLAALMVFDHALAERPADADLLAARGWLMGRIPDDQLREIGAASLDEALALDPFHPAALVYRAHVRTQLGDLDGARVDLAAFDELDERPATIVDLVVELGLREALAAGD